MGLLNYYDDRNKVEHTALKIWLNQKQHWGNYYWFTRTATKTYSYVGMDKKTAISCAYDKQSQYQYYETLYDQQMSAYTKNMVQGANVEAIHQDGNLWNVDINVDVNDECSFIYDGQGEPSIQYINSKFYLQDFDEDPDSPLVIGEPQQPEPVVIYAPTSDGEG